MKQQANRRYFLKVAASAVAVPYLIPGSALGADGRPAPSNRIVMGGIGIGNQGSGDQGAYLGHGEVQYVAACDVSEQHLKAALDRANKRYHNKDCKPYHDFRELLARPDIEAVHVATPDHWHIQVVIEACRHGKDVYCQKPETRTLHEGKLVVAAARRYGRIVSGGSQRVLEDYRKQVNPCWSGELGPIKSINVNVGPLPQLCYLPGQPVPDGFDWDMWLGPAPWAPYHPYRCSGSYNINGTCWRSFSDYSGGGMTDWGAHHFGGAVFAIDCREPATYRSHVSQRRRQGVPDLPLSQRHPADAQSAGLQQSPSRGHARRKARTQAGPGLQGPRRHLWRFPLLRQEPRGKALPRHRVGREYGCRVPLG